MYSTYFEQLLGSVEAGKRQKPPPPHTHITAAIITGQESTFRSAVGFGGVMRPGPTGHVDLTGWVCVPCVVPR